jgi:fructokinase
MTNKVPQIVCFGEILWDVFPDKKVIGGAPLNVALRLHSLGNKTAIISKIGKDGAGRKAMEYLLKVGLIVSGVQTDSLLKTGEVLVTLDENGSAAYVIMEPVAWDAIEGTPEAIDLVKQAPIFIFGSLSSRRPKSKESLMKMLKVARFSVFDVNLRPPYFSMEMILELIRQADFIKMNDDELTEICRQLACPYSELESSAKWLMDRENLNGLCITKGAHGAFLIYNGQIYAHQGYKVKVADTVGAGDSFLATLVTELFVKKVDPDSALDMASRMGALVASKGGANCEISESELQMLHLNS